MKKIISIILAVILTATLFAGCSNKSKEPNEPAKDKKDGITVVCSIFPIYDFCREIMGDKGSIELLLDSKTDMHSYEPTASDILKISNADLFINIGGESEEWAEGVIESAANPDLKVLSLINAVNAVEEEALEGMQEEEEEEETGEEEGPELDEHVWTSLKNAQMMVQKISETLCEIDSENAEHYKANSNAYAQKLASLEKQYGETVSAAKRNVLLFADRFPFRYLADDYSLQCFAAFSGCSAESEASFETMTNLVEKTKEYELPFILIIEGSDGSVAESVSAQTGAQIKVLNSCQSVSKEDIENGAGYLSIMESNLEVLKEVLN